jgi:hypothetical protein
MTTSPSESPFQPPASALATARGDHLSHTRQLRRLEGYKHEHPRSFEMVMRGRELASLDEQEVRNAIAELRAITRGQLELDTAS